MKPLHFECRGRWYKVNESCEMTPEKIIQSVPIASSSTVEANHAKGLRPGIIRWWREEYVPWKESWDRDVKKRKH